MNVDGAAGIGDVFPNPANDHVTISFASAIAGETKISLFNDVGECVFAESCSTGETFSLSTATLPAGHYLLKVSGDNSQCFVSSIVIAH